MDGFGDLLTDAFSESSVPSFSDGDLDFENLNFDEKGEEDKADNLTTKSAEALLQEATSENEVSLDKATTDTPLTTADAYEEQTDDEDDEVNFMSEAPADECTSSGEEGSSSGEDAEMDAGMTEESGDLLMSVCSSENLQNATKEERIFAEGQPVASDNAHDPKVSNEVEDEAESDEEVSDVEEIPVQEDEMMTKSADEQEREEESSDEPKGLNEEHQQEAQTSYKTNPVEDCLEFPGLSPQNLQDLITEVDGEEYVDKMTDFTEDEHQEAGESFADYPSDFSSGEYTRDEGKNEEKVPTVSHHTQQEGAVTESQRPPRAEDAEKDDGFLYRRDLEMNADEITTLEVAVEQQEETKSESDESTSSSSSDDEDSLRRCEEVSDNMSVQDGENYKKLESIQLHDNSSAEFSRWSLSDDHNRNDRADLADFIRSEFDVLKSDTLLSEYLFTTEDSDETDDPPSGVNQHLVEDGNHSVVEKEEANPTTYNQGSIDDSFFFDTELDTSEVPEVRQLTDQEYEERRNYEQMQERIEAFKRFYGNSDEENGGEERQIKVQFCADPLSQIIHYETDSSDQESYSSYSDREEEEEDDYDEEEEEEERIEEEEQEKLEEGEKVEEEEEEENLLGDEEENVEEDEKEEEEEEDKVVEEEEEENLLEEEEENVGEKEEKVEEEDEEKNLLEEEEEAEMEGKTKEEDLSSAEIFDELMEPEDSLQMDPVCNPANVHLSKKLSEARDTQTCTKTHKGLSVLKLMVRLGMVTAMGLLMFCLISDQPDWLRDVFSV